MMSLRLCAIIEYENDGYLLWVPSKHHFFIALVSVLKCILQTFVTMTKLLNCYYTGCKSTLSRRQPPIFKAPKQILSFLAKKLKLRFIKLFLKVVNVILIL